ncbi:MAG: ribonuclease HI [Holophagaceae bacterium]
MTTRTYQLFTDGACLGNPGPGGWASILREADGSDVIQTGGEPSSTNNRMELLAVIEALESLSEPSRVTIYSDSEYVLKGLSEWMPGWKAKGWKKADGKTVMNLDLWQRLDGQSSRHQLTTHWVKGHAGHPENERVDFLANTEAQRWAHSS